MKDCKIHHENMMIDNQPATDFAMADVYLVELTDKFSVISGAPRSRRLLVGSDVSEILTFQVSHDLRKYLLAYGDMPVIIPTASGDALVLPQVFSSARVFALVFFKGIKPESLLRVAASERFEGRVGLLEVGDRGRMSKWDEPLASRLELVLDVAENIFKKSLISTLDDRAGLIENIHILFDSISRLIGVCADVSIEDSVLADECFDPKLFNAFCLAMLMLGERYANADEADVRVFMRELGLSVSISFASAKRITRVKNPELAHFNAISDANNMIFASSCEDGRFEVTFTPARKDWSFLELKVPSDFII